MLRVLLSGAAAHVTSATICGHPALSGLSATFSTNDTIILGRMLTTADAPQNVSYTVEFADAGGNVVILTAFPDPAAIPLFSGDCPYGDWSTWSACTVPCGRGTHWRRRSAPPGSGCAATMFVGECNTDPCGARAHTRAHTRAHPHRAALGLTSRTLAARAVRLGSTKLVISLTVVGVSPAAASGAFLDAMRAAVSAALGVSAAVTNVEGVLNSTLGPNACQVVFDIDAPLTGGAFDWSIANNALVLAMEDGAFAASLSTYNSSVPYRIVVDSVSPIDALGSGSGRVQLEDTSLFDDVVAALSVVVALAVLIVCLRRWRRELGRKRAPHGIEVVMAHGVVPQPGAAAAGGGAVRSQVNPLWRR